MYIFLNGFWKLATRVLLLSTLLLRSVTRVNAIAGKGLSRVLS